MPQIEFQSYHLFPSATGGEFYRFDSPDSLNSCRVDSRYKGLITHELEQLDLGTTVELHVVPDRNGIPGDWRIDLEHYKALHIAKPSLPVPPEFLPPLERRYLDGSSITFTVSPEEHEFMHRLHKKLCKLEPRFRRFQDFNRFFYSQLVQMLRATHPELTITPEDFPF
jgi:hypothetical protein